MTLGLAFLNPLLLWALPLIAVPIVIHLLNRRRFDKRRWAAMEFLLRAMRLNRRRLQMEQWLVLLLRTLAVLLLVLLVARPRLAGGVLGNDIGHHVVCLDDSPSMAHRGGADDAMDRAREAVIRLATNVAEERPGDLFSLVRTSTPGQALLAAVPSGADLPRRVREAVAPLRPSDVALDLAVLLPKLDDVSATAQAADRTETYVVTDLRRRDWVARGGEPNAAFVAWLAARDPESQHLQVIDVGARDQENVAVIEVRCADRVAIAGVPMNVVVDVKNFGRDESSPAELTVEVDGKNRSAMPVPAIAAGETARLAFVETFHLAGWHGVRAALPNDRYAVDDARSFAVEVRAASKVLVFDGAIGEAPEDAETFYLAAALEGGDGATFGIDVRVHPDHELATVPVEELARADLLLLANVARVTPEVVARLEDFARQGGGIAFWLGDQIDVANYSQLLWKNGQGLLPLQPVGVAGDLDQPKGVHLVDGEQPLFAHARDALRTMFAQLVLVGRWITLREDPNAAVDIALRVGDADGEPLLVGKPFGDGGRVHVIATSSDAGWTDWPRWPAFLITLERLHATTARPQDFGRTNLRPDGTLIVDVDPSRHRPDVEVRSRGGDAEARTFAAPPSGADVVAVKVPMAELAGTGLFAVVRKTHAGGEDTLLCARNPLPEEGELEPLGSAALVGSLPEELRERVTVREGQEQATTRDAGGGSLWRWLGLVMLFAMLLESVLAWRFGRR